MDDASRANTNHRQFLCRGVRGATVALADTPAEIHAATTELVVAMLRANGIEPDDLASAIFTTTPDLRSAFPAGAMRLAGWEHVPMLGAVEMDNEGGLPRCIRVLLHWNTTKGQHEIRHIYLRGTESLRTPGNEAVNAISNTEKEDRQR